MAPGLAENQAHQLALAFTLPALDDLLRMGTDLVSRDAAKIGMEATDQSLADVRMKLRLEMRKMGILARQNPFFKNAFFQKLLQQCRHILEVLARLVLHAALRMPAVIPGKPVAASAAR